MGWEAKCLSRQAHRMICNMIYLGQSVTLTLRDQEVKVTKKKFGVTKYVNRSALLEKHDGCKISALSQITKLLTKNYHPEQWYFFSLT